MQVFFLGRRRERFARRKKVAAFGAILGRGAWRFDELQVERGINVGNEKHRNVSRKAAQQDLAMQWLKAPNQSPQERPGLQIASSPEPSTQTSCHVVHHHHPVGYLAVLPHAQPRTHHEGGEQSFEEVSLLSVAPPCGAFVAML